MYMRDLMDMMAHAEFRQLYLDSKGRLEIDEVNRREFYVNTITILNKIYSKFVLRVNTLKVLIQPGQTLYDIDKYNIVGSPGSNTKYIEAPDGFEEDYIKSLRVLVYENEDYFDAMDSGINLSNSFRFMAMNKIKIPSTFTGDHFLVEYQASHPKISVEDCIATPDLVYLELPVQFHEALRSGIAAQKFGNTGIAVTGEGEKKINFHTKFISEMDRIIFDGNHMQYGDYVDQSFHSKGWV